MVNTLVMTKFTVWVLFLCRVVYQKSCNRMCQFLSLYHEEHFLIVLLTSSCMNNNKQEFKDGRVYKRESLDE